MGGSEVSLNNANLYPLCMSPPLSSLDWSVGVFFFSSLTRNDILCQIKFQQSVN